MNLHASSAAGHKKLRLGNGRITTDLIEQFIRGVHDTHAKDHAVHHADTFKTLNGAVKEAESVINRKEMLTVYQAGFRQKK